MGTVGTQENVGHCSAAGDGSRGLKDAAGVPARDCGSP